MNTRDPKQNSLTKKNKVLPVPSFNPDKIYFVVIAVFFVCIGVYYAINFNKVKKSTVSVLSGKKSKFASPLHIGIGLFLSFVTGYMTYLYVQKKNKEEGQEIYGLKYPITSGLLVMICYNMITREAGITF